MELREWASHVAIIEPGAVRTPIWDKGMKRAQEMIEQLPEDGLDLYRYLINKVKEAAADAARTAVDPAKGVEAVNHAITSPKPKTRYVIGRDPKMRLSFDHLPDPKHDNLSNKHVHSYKT